MTPIASSTTVAPMKHRFSFSFNPRKRSKSRKSAGDDEIKKIQRELELRDEAKKYNPSDHGLVGILNWTPTKRKHDLRVCFGSLGEDYSSDASGGEPELRKEVKPITKFLLTVKCTRTLASIRIQSVVKGFLQRRRRRRLQDPIMALQRKLKQIELQRERELEEISRQKWIRMKQVRYELESESRRIAETAEKVQMLIKYLREENTKIEARNNNVAESIEILKKLNHQHNATTNLLLDNYSTMSLAVDVLAKKNAKLLEKKAKYEQRLAKYEQCLLAT